MSEEGAAAKRPGKHDRMQVQGRNELGLNQHTHRRMDKPTDRQIGRSTDRKTVGKSDKQTSHQQGNQYTGRTGNSRNANGQLDRQTGIL